MSMLEEIKNSQFSKKTLAYFGQRARNEWSSYILEKFAVAESEGLTKAELARRISKRPEQITRILSAPGNWTIETIQSLLLGICGEEMVPNSTSILGHSPKNYRSPDWAISPSTEVNIYAFSNDTYVSSNEGLRSKVFAVRLTELESR